RQRAGAAHGSGGRDSSPSASGNQLCLASHQSLKGVFSPCRGTTAVCAYSMDKVTHAFKTSKLKGYTSVLPAHRPGTVRPARGGVRVPKQLPRSNEGTPVSDSERRCGGDSELLWLAGNYQRAARGSHNNSRTVLYLGTDKGKIHKVLQSGGQTVIIAELSPFQRDAPISGMALDASTVSALPPLYLCSVLNTGGCGILQDPYCGWDPDSKKCSAISREANDTARSLKKVSVDPTSYIYLPCPLRSHHAIYTWVKDGSKQYPCAMDGHSCTLRFGENAPMDQGLFKCTATEDGYLEEITAYKLTLNTACIPQLSVTVAAGVLFLVITILLL
uniref:Ig-like domain-containing protein n=1 Tax=Terrapene triunguis TaxID=2587831 RepID=A0A674ISC2_9SAUR